jgi:hypothetical protein
MLQTYGSNEKVSNILALAARTQSQMDHDVGKKLEENIVQKHIHSKVELIRPSEEILVPS